MFRSVAVGTNDPAALRAELRQLPTHGLGRRRARVALWGLRSTHQYRVLPPAKAADLQALARREARRDLTALEADGQPAAVDVVVGGSASVPGAGTKRQVVLAAAAGADLQKRLQPLVDAGFSVDSVVTAPLALLSLARLRRTVAPGAIVAYVAVNADVTALAVVRNGLVLFAREIPWGYGREASKAGPPKGGPHEVVSGPPQGGHDTGALDLEKVAERLASELRRSFLFFKQNAKLDVDSIAVCGDLPELRSMTASLIAALDQTVEILDSTDGLEAVGVSETAEAFRGRIAELRVAWAIAADPAAPLNLLPADVRIERASRRRHALVGGGVAAALLVTSALYLQADRSARANEQLRHNLQLALGTLEPQARAMETARTQDVVRTARQAALQAFDTQGPRLARALEALANAAPREIALNQLKVEPGGVAWRVTLVGVSVAADPGDAQGAVNRFLGQLESSPYLGAPVRPPALRVASGTGRSTETGAAESTATRSQLTGIPQGMSGIEFSVEFEIKK